MLDLETPADLQRLIDEGLQESLTLDYKASPALNKTNEGRAELVKDVTAFANSAGGQIIYGIPEDNGAPQRLDAGIDCQEITPEWIEQVVDTNSAPRIQGLKVTKIVLDNAKPNMVAYVISVPQATAFAPHQNSLDKKYYRRFERRSVPMHDYEIRDLLRRSNSPELIVTVKFPSGNNQIVRIEPNEKFQIFINIENVSSEPALYTIFEFCFDHRLILVDDAKLIQKADITVGENVLHRLQHQFKVPGDFPLVKGSSIDLGPPYVALSIPDAYFFGQQSFLIVHNSLAPGFKRTRFGFLLLDNLALSFSEFHDI